MSEQGWFEVQRFGRGITMIREPHHREDVKSYLVEGEREVAVLDTGCGVDGFPAIVAEISDRQPIVLQTHAHWDHIGASHLFTDVRVHPTEAEGLRAGYPAARHRVAMGPESADISRLPADFSARAGIPRCEPTGWLNHGDQIDLGGRTLEVFHTPGHSPGGVTFLDRSGRALFVGDLVYLARMLIHFPESDASAFRESLQLAAELAAEVDEVFPAHGPAPITPADVREIRNAYEEVMHGRAPDRDENLYGYPATTHAFGRFSFHLKPA